MCFVSFGSVNVHAASEENLISWNLTEWSELPSTSAYVQAFSGNKNIQSILISSHSTSEGNSVTEGLIFDLTSSSLKVGDVYNLSFNFLNPDPYINSALGSGAFQKDTASLTIGLGSSFGDYVLPVENCYITINNTNYLSLYDTKVSLSFELPSGVTNPCIFINYYSYNQGNSVYLVFSDFSFINESKSEEDGFIDKFINGIKGLFVPDEAFVTSWTKSMEDLASERLGIIWQAGDFLVTLVTTVVDLVVNAPEEISLALPAIDIEVAGMNIHLWDEQKVDFSFLDTNAFFSMFYSLYKVVLNVSFGIPLLHYARKELDNTLHN